MKTTNLILKLYCFNGEQLSIRFITFSDMLNVYDFFKHNDYKHVYSKLEMWNNNELLGFYKFTSIL